MAQEDQVLKIMMKQLGMEESEELLTEWPTWPFTRLTPRQVHHLDMLYKKKLKLDKTQDISNCEEAPF
jgi:hypothetical protein